MSRINDSDDLHVTAGEYVLGTLSHEEREAFAARLRVDSVARKTVLDWEERFFPFQAIVEPLVPSESLFPRIERSMQELLREAGTSEQRVSTPRSLLAKMGFWQFATGVGFAAGLVLGLTLARPEGEVLAPDYMVMLLAPSTQTTGWVIQSANRQQIQLIPLQAFEVPEGKALEFWTKADGWQLPISLGLIEPGKPTVISLDQLPPLEQNQLFELTLEDASGSVTGLPTGPIEFIGRAIEI